MINVRMQQKPVEKLSPKIVVVGVGGAGGNAVNNMISSDLQGVEFIVCNTDAQALENSYCETKIQLGAGVTGGLGAGAKPEVGESAAQESLDVLMERLQGANMVFITAGMGGGTGTGAAPVIAKACREEGILTVGVVTKPFHFEGATRMEMAEAGLKEMQQYVDTLIVIPNQNLFRIANEKTTFTEAFRLADSVLQSGVRGVTDLIVLNGLVNLDFADVRSAMLEMGKAMMGTGEAEGERRAIEAAEAGINNPLLDDVTMKGARGVIINVTGGSDMTLFEVDEACNRVRDEVDPNANIIFGSTFDDSLEGVMRVSIVATGIDAESVERKTRSGGFSGFTTSTKSGKLGNESGSGVYAKTEQKIERAVPNTVEASPETKSGQSQILASFPNKGVPFDVRTSGIKAPSQQGGQSPGSYQTQSAVPAKSISPKSASLGVSIPKAPAPLPSQENAGLSEEPESDLFEQGQYIEAKTAHPKATIFNEAFIPPQPVHVDKNEQDYAVPEMEQSAMGGNTTGHLFPESQPGSQERSEKKSASEGAKLSLKPPVPGIHYHGQQGAAAPAKKKPASLFERFANQLRGHGHDQEESTREETETETGSSSSGGFGAIKPSQHQGQHNSGQTELRVERSQISSSGERQEGELDIPAFLRRQAN